MRKFLFKILISTVSAKYSNKKKIRNITSYLLIFSVRSIWNHLVKLARDDKKTIVITTHYIEEARQATIVNHLITY